MPDGWRYWLNWMQLIAPENAVEISALEADRGRFMGYIRAIARLRADVRLSEPITSVPTEYYPHTLLRAE
jgi:hypothetical protein